MLHADFPVLCFAPSGYFGRWLIFCCVSCLNSVICFIANSVNYFVNYAVDFVAVFSKNGTAVQAMQEQHPALIQGAL